MGSEKRKVKSEKSDGLQVKSEKWKVKNPSQKSKLHATKGQKHIGGCQNSNKAGWKLNKHIAQGSVLDVRIDKSKTPCRGKSIDI